MMSEIDTTPGEHKSYQQRTEHAQDMSNYAASFPSGCWAFSGVVDSASTWQCDEKPPESRPKRKWNNNAQQKSGLGFQRSEKTCYLPGKGHRPRCTSRSRSHTDVVIVDLSPATSSACFSTTSWQLCTKRSPMNVNGMLRVTECGILEKKERTIRSTKRREHHKTKFRRS